MDDRRYCGLDALRGGLMLVPYDLPAVFKFLCVAAFTTIVCFLTYHYWVQRTWVSDFLNGRRFDLNWPWRGRKPAAVSPQP